MANTGGESGRIECGDTSRLRYECPTYLDSVSGIWYLVVGAQKIDEWETGADVRLACRMAIWGVAILRCAARNNCNFSETWSLNAICEFKSKSTGDMERAQPYRGPAVRY